MMLFFFFFKQKTAYEIQGDWSSDVCSSDLRGAPQTWDPRRLPRPACPPAAGTGTTPTRSRRSRAARSEERRVGKEAKCSWETQHKTKQKIKQIHNGSYKH